ncbi:MAG: PrgI family protein [Minisyncoccia bacterium]
MEYQIPQFIEVEDKIFGPFTFRQFIYLAGGAGACVVAFLYLPLFLAILASLPIAGLAAALAFYKINNKPFIEIMEAAFTYFTGGRLYLWRKEVKTDTQMKETAPKPSAAPAPERLGVSASKLHQLAWSLDVQDQEKKES